MLVHPSLPMKIRKMLACDVFDTAAMPAGLVCALTQSGGHKMAALTVMFHDFQTLIFNKQDEKAS